MTYKIVNPNVKITAIAHYVPTRVVDNEELAKRYPKAGNAEDILGKTGMHERRYCADNESTMDMATAATKALIKKANIDTRNIDAIIMTTLTPETFFPSNAAQLANNVGIYEAKKGYDVSNSCPGFLTALNDIASNIALGKYKNAILCVSDNMSKTLDSWNYKTGILFGDAACAVLIEPTSEKGINGQSSMLLTEHINDI